VTVHCLFNGRSEPGAWVASRGLHYADGVFRTVLVVDGRIVDVDRQVAKLAADAAALDLEQRAVRAALRDARKLATACDRGVIKMMLWRKSEGRGYRPTTREAECLVLRHVLPALKRSSWTRGIVALRSDVILSAQPRLAGVKHLGRIEQVLASARWGTGVDESIQCDAGGHPISGTRSNLFWITDGALYTPELSVCGVAGAMRQKVLEAAQALGVRWRIGAWRWRDLEHSDEAFVTNSLIGIWPLRRCARTRWSAPGELTRRLMQTIDHPLTPAS
jgi:4-amino-4-deoxychorismate lyase